MWCISAKSTLLFIRVNTTYEPSFQSRGFYSCPNLENWQPCSPAATRRVLQGTNSSDYLYLQGYLPMVQWIFASRSPYGTAPHSCESRTAHKSHMQVHSELLTRVTHLPRSFRVSYINHKHRTNLTRPSRGSPESRLIP